MHIHNANFTTEGKSIIKRLPDDFTCYDELLQPANSKLHL